MLGPPFRILDFLRAAVVSLGCRPSLGTALLPDCAPVRLGASSPVLPDRGQRPRRRGHSLYVMRWIKVAVGVADDPKIAALADRLGVPIESAVGLWVQLLCHLPDHARDGNLALVPDVALERWVGWRGEPSVFAAAVRAIFCGSSGVIETWEKHNGAAIRAADAAVERAAEWRKKKSQGQSQQRDTRVRRTLRVPNAHRTPLRDGNTLKSITPVPECAPPEGGSLSDTGDSTGVIIHDDGRRYRPIRT